MAKPKMTAEELAAQFGFAAAFFNAVPELKKLLKTALKQKWTAARFQAAFTGSKWYRSNQSNVREWVELQKRDPATAKFRVSEQTLKLQNMASQLGVSIKSDTLKRFAENSLKFGWSDEHVRRELANFWKYEEKGQRGQAASLESQIRQAADDYGVTVTNKQLEDLIRGSIGGKITEDHVADLFKDQAASKYAGLRADLDKGFTVRQIADPYIAEYAKLMEVGDDTVSLASNQHIQRALQGVAAKPGEEPQRVSVYEFARQVRKDPAWRRTRNAHEEAQNTTMQVLRDWGLYS